MPNNKSIKIIILIALTAAVAGGAFYFGYQKGTFNPKEVTVKGVTNVGDEDVKADFGVFWQVWNKIKTEHINGENAEEKDLVYGAISGMVDSLKDPNTVFFPPEDAKKFEEDVSGSFGGIGAEIGIRNDQLVIIAPLKNTPAEKAGLKSNDKILLIDKTPTTGLNVNEAVKLIRGEIGASITLTILRNGWEEPKEFTIIRETITVPTLDWESKDGQIALIKLYGFNENAPYLFYKAALQTLLNESKGIILDLRNNPGGFLEVSVDIAGWFLDRGTVVVTERFRSGNEIIFRSRGNAALKNLPMVILVNQGSASASEILAGALRDHREIKLIGEKSFGKGSVQELQDLKDGSSLKITVANWILPKGQIIDKTGLAPDYEAKITEEDVSAGRDPQLDKALEVLKSLIVK